MVVWKGLSPYKPDHFDQLLSRQNPVYSNWGHKQTEMDCFDYWSGRYRGEPIANIGIFNPLGKNYFSFLKFEFWKRLMWFIRESGIDIILFDYDTDLLWKITFHNHPT